MDLPRRIGLVGYPALRGPRRRRSAPVTNVCPAPATHPIMATPINLSIPHQRGRAEARRRIEVGFARSAFSKSPLGSPPLPDRLAQ